MAIYRKIDCRISNDKKFRELSVEGKLAWYTILSRRDLAPIGAFKASFESLAIEQRGNEYLNKGFEKAFGEAFLEALYELSSKGLIKYDPEAFLIYVPNFLRFNFPENPNVVKSWNSVLDSLPECDLTNYALAKSTEIILNSQKDSFFKALPKEFVEAFEKGYGKGFQEDFGKGLAKQEQEQEQEHIRKENTKEKNPPTTSGLENQSEDELPFSEPESQTVSKTETVEKKAKRKSKAKQPCPFNDGDAIPEDFVKVAEQYHIANPQLLFQKMISYCKSNGKEYVDYKAAFRTFCIQDQERNHGKQSSGTNSNNSAPMPYEPPGGFTEDYYRKGCKFDDKGNILL
jgi:hypothetical protein